VHWLRTILLRIGGYQMYIVCQEDWMFGTVSLAVIVAEAEQLLYEGLFWKAL